MSQQQPTGCAFAGQNLAGRRTAASKSSRELQATLQTGLGTGQDSCAGCMDDTACDRSATRSVTALELPTDSATGTVA